jgi:hypothetical protein
MSPSILLTFDYELPLGGIIGNLENALFKQSQKLLEFADIHNVKLNFFVDILSYYAFKEKNPGRYNEGFKTQIEQILKKNHSVQLHIHPHWLETEFKENRFIPSDKFKLADFEDIQSVINLSINELNSLCRSIKPKYRPLAYRGGGYNLEPCTKTIFDSLLKNEIIFDSSIPPGYYFKSNLSEIDYRKIKIKPFSKIYGNENKIILSENKGLTEIPIATIPKSFFEVPTTLKMLFKKNYKPVNNGVMIHQGSVTLKDKLKMICASRMLTIDNYTYSPAYLKKIINYNLNNSKRESAFCLIGHPKSMSDYSFKLLTGVVEYCREKNFSILTYEDMC